MASPPSDQKGRPFQYLRATTLTPAGMPRARLTLFERAMSHAESLPFESASVARAAAPDPPVVIIGGGPVGMRAAQELTRRGRAVTVLSAEPHQPYNRVRLTPLLGGDVQFGDIALPALPDPDGRAVCLTGQRVVEIDRAEHMVRTADGSLYPYAQLIIATGSRAFVPGIPGKDLPGVYTFRTAEDASALLARSISARTVAVIGGGLLGLEAARGMRPSRCAGCRDRTRNPPHASTAGPGRRRIADPKDSRPGGGCPLFHGREGHPG